MKSIRNIPPVFAAALFSVALAACAGDGGIHSPYAGQETRRIKALSPEDIAGLRAGAGTPFGGMAKAAELNGYPGPRHVLDAASAGKLRLSARQKERVQTLHAEMQTRAAALGEQMIAAERKIDDGFKNAAVTESALAEYLSDSAAIYGRLRFTHLKYHLKMMEVLTPEQVAQYNALRGYGGDICAAGAPEGHDETLWRRHNNCE